MSTSIETLTQIAWEWGLRCFGKEHMSNKPMRALRLAEECIEYTQTTGLPKDQLHKVVDTVYSRPVGNPLQELGGVMVCAAVCIKNEGTLLGATTLEYAFDMEVRRILAKSPEDFAKRNQEKIDMGLDARAYRAGSDQMSTKHVKTYSYSSENAVQNDVVGLLSKLARRAMQYSDRHCGLASIEVSPLGVVIYLRRGQPFRDMKQLVMWEQVATAKLDILGSTFSNMVLEFERDGHEVKA